jgi:phage shock protein B
MSVFIFVLMILFLTIVAPLWIIVHYLTKWRMTRGLSAEDERLLAELWESASRMEGRIVTLEKILDAEAPGWRARQ